MAQFFSNSETERCLRIALENKGYKLNTPLKSGELGVDIIAEKGNERHYIEVIGFKKSPPARSRDFYEVFFRAISRLKDGAKSIVTALPERFENGLKQRASQYGEGWKRIGDAFPELKIWLVNCDGPSFKQKTWNEWL
ncbi:MAG: hypothetical protein JRI77_14930 [Deltaproteobacteria bacterium]|nr:hypothetical protein [Deltaproteobacteria bacterium]